MNSRPIIEEFIWSGENDSIFPYKCTVFYIACNCWLDLFNNRFFRVITKIEDASVCDRAFYHISAYQA